MSRIFSLGTLVTRCKERADMEFSSFIADTEWKGYISTVFAELHELLVASGLRYAEKIQILTTHAAAAATGTITTVAAASLTDGETFTIDDGRNNPGPYVFEFDTNGAVTSGNTAVDISGATTATNVRDAIISAINGTTIGITASSGGSATVTLTNDATGTAGNTTSAETVANATFAVTNMTGGLDVERYALPTGYLGTVGVDYQWESSTPQWRRLDEIMAQERNRFATVGPGQAVGYAIIGSELVLYPTPPAGQVYRHVFIPMPADLSSAADATSVDVVLPAGEDFVIWGVTRMALAKEESDTLVAFKNFERARERLMEAAQLRAINQPRRKIVEDQFGYDSDLVNDPASWRWRLGGY